MSEVFTQDKILKVLKKTRIFHQFEEAQLSRLISFSAVKEFDKGAVIIKERQKNDRFYVLLEGSVSVYAEDEFIVKFEQQGSLFGEMSVIKGDMTVADIIADSPVVLFAVSASRIYGSDHLELRSMVYKIFLDILTEKLTATTDRVKGFQATSQELTVKKQELEESKDDLYQKEVILQSVLGSMSDGIVVTEAHGRLLHVNDAFRKMVGSALLPSEFDQWPQKIGIYHGDEQTLYTVDELPMMKISRGIRVDSEEIFVNNPRLSEGIWLHATSSLLKTEEEANPQGAVVLFHDYTKKKKEEQALIEAKEEAEAMSKAKSDFLAVMSHELRTPLNGIMGMTDLIYTTDLDVEQKDCIDTIKTSSENLLTLVRNILDYTNLESGVLKVENQLFSIWECFKDIIDSYALPAARKGIEILSNISPDLPHEIEGDARGLKQILRNLTDNAVKFSKGGIIVLSAALKTNADNSNEILFAVQDQGIGIEVKDLQDLFKPFSQADSSYSRNYDGIGVGLSICRKMIELMNGRIWVESEPGKGSRFLFTVRTTTPLRDGIDGTAQSEPSQEQEPLKNPKQIVLDPQFADKYAMKILVAEDNAMNQKLITKVLKKLGYAPQMAGNGLEAVEALRKEPFDLVLMDLQMPEMDGVEASRIICQELSRNDKPTIIALTANVSDDVKRDCYEAGMKDYMTKPLKINKLAKILQKWA